MNQLNWGIIGCGDVTEVKSGPAFNKVENSSLIAVMRRDAAKAADYAKRHQVKKFFTEADDLISDNEVNAIYIATPPAFHEDYAIAALEAGKPVYVEKPMALNAAGCLRMINAAKQFNGKLTIAHYRRFQPKYLKIKKDLADGLIGKILFIDLKFLQSINPNLIAQTEDNWRIDPELSGGGLFHDMAPHQLDLMIYFFGLPKQMKGIALNQLKLNHADDFVTGEIIFENEIAFKGLWSFGVNEAEVQDTCEIYGTNGKISFSVFGYDYAITVNGKTTMAQFDVIAHVQQPMINQVVKYFLGEVPNPCAAEEALQVVKIMDAFTARQ